MTDFTNQSLAELSHHDAFIARHIGPDEAQTQQMLAELGYDSIEALVDAIVPADIKLANALNLKSSASETDSLKELANMVEQNHIKHSMIGLGYHDTIIPPVIQRNVLENPGWYTAYTPYQPEIAQGRLEAILNFQQMVMDLTGMSIANASLLDEGTAAAEAMAMAKRVVKGNKSSVFFVADNCLPQTITVIKTRARLLDIEVVVDSVENLDNFEYFGVLFQNPAKDGQLVDLTPYIETVHAAKAIAIVAADLLSLVAVKSPGEMGADIVVGNSQRFGVPMGFGGPHAAFFATQEKYKRSIPGRIIGVSVDSRENTALRMAMQTREQHIRREKATSNICTAQVLLANLAVFYAIYHGPEGLKRIAQRAHRLARILATGLEAANVTIKHQNYFDTLTVECDANAVITKAAEAGFNLYKIDAKTVSLSVNECTTGADIAALWTVFLGDEHGYQVDVIDAQIKAKDAFGGLARTSSFLTHSVFNSYHSETDMLRYLKKLENKDLSLTHAMISLGSCTMKLNATSEMMPVSWPHINRMHPFAPAEQTKGYAAMLADLEKMLEAITGLDAVSLQPNSGAQGEYAGLLAIRNYLDSINQEHRNVCLIPRSAHGTNPASAAMAGMRVVVVECDDLGNIDQADLAKKAEDVADQLACLMITYPSTHGVYEDGIKEICDTVHKFGGQVYMDGANLNAQVGITSPGEIGADVTHMNLHKTFSIPHGGGGPGMGPIGVRAHLAPFLPKNPLEQEADVVVNSAPFGSASILTISWMYIRMMGAQGLKQATEYALLNANYIAKKLANHYPILYTGHDSLVAHECILDLRPLKEASGITEVDIAKRLMDYGFHAPTMSFPVPGTFMVEPTESESKIELDRFIEAMIAIKQEIDDVAAGKTDADNNPLKNAPHTQKDIADTWERPYSIEQAIFPVKGLYEQKFWPTVNRINDVYGDRNLICSCPAIEAYED